MAKSSDFLKNKNVVITGGSSGLGKAIGISAAQQGANVVILARDVKKLEGAKKEILESRKSKSQQVEMYSVDLGNAEAVEEIVRSFPSKPDYLFCAAGGAKKENGFFTDLQPKDFQACFDNNYFSAVFISQICLKLWLEEDEEAQRASGTRHIVFVSSKAAFVGLPGYSPYTSSKVALRALADTLRQELLLYGEDRFKVHCAFPGSFMTESIVAGKVEMPELTKILEGIDDTQENLLKSKPSSMNMACWILDAVAKGDFMITTDLEGKLLLNNMRGPSPRDHHFWDLLCSWLTVPVWAYYRRMFDRKTLEYGKTMRKKGLDH